MEKEKEAWSSLKDLKGEIWKDVLNHEGLYKVSNLGRVKSLKRKYVPKDIIMKQSPDGGGYLMVSLTLNRKSKSRKVHQLVAEVFLGHIPCGMKRILNHISGDIKDNRAINLEIVSNRQNVSTCWRRNEGTYSSKYIGVYWDKELQKWRSRIEIRGIHYSLGTHDLEIDASNAYQEALENKNNQEYLDALKPTYSSSHSHVYYDKDSDRWRANCKGHDNKLIYVGRYLTELEAYHAQQQYIKDNNLPPLN